MTVREKSVNKGVYIGVRGVFFPPCLVPTTTLPRTARYVPRYTTCESAWYPLPKHRAPVADAHATLSSRTDSDLEQHLSSSRNQHVQQSRSARDANAKENEAVEIKCSEEFWRCVRESRGTHGPAWLAVRGAHCLDMSCL